MSELNIETIDINSKSNLLYVINLNNYYIFVDSSPVVFDSSTGKNKKVFSSDSVIFNRDMSIVFPYFTPDYVKYIDVDIYQKTSKTSLILSLDLENSLKSSSYIINDETINYVYANITLPSNINGNFEIMATVYCNGTTYKYIRKLYFINKLDINFSKSNQYLTKDLSGSVKSDLIVGHSSDLRISEYSLIPYDFNGGVNNSNLANTKTFSNSISKIETNNFRKNIHFDFDPITIPVPTYQSDLKELSVELDTETLIKNMAGIEYGDSAIPKYYLISNVGDWEFWAIYINTNYNGSEGIENSNVRPFIVIKNNSKFTNSVLLIDLFSNGSFRKQWEPNLSANSDFWYSFKDDVDFFEAIRNKYLNDDLHESPFSSTGVGIESNILFKKTPNISKPEEYISVKFKISVSNNDYFDIVLEATNNTSQDLKFIGFDYGVVFEYSNNFNFCFAGAENLNYFTKNYCNVKYNDSSLKLFDWNPENRVHGSLTQIGKTLSEIFGGSITSIPDSRYISTGETIKSLIEISPISPFDTKDPRNDERFINSEKDPRWYAGPLDLVQNQSDLYHNWPYIDPNNNLDSWHKSIVNASKIEPFIIFERDIPSFESERGVIAIVAQNPYAMLYETEGNVPAYPSTSPLPAFGAANEYKTKIGMLSGIETIKAKSKESTVTRFYYDTKNTSRESWVSNVYSNIDWNGNYIANVSSGSSNSFKNNLEIVLKSAINDKINISDDIHFKNPYTYIDNNDFFFAINNEDGVAIQNKISLVNNNIKIYPIQKTNYFYTSNRNKNFELYENVSKISIYVDSYSTDLLFTEGSTIKQMSTGAIAFVIKEEIPDLENSRNRILFINKIFGNFKINDSMVETKNFKESAATAALLTIPVKIYDDDNLLVRFIKKDNFGNKIGADNIFSVKFDRSYPVNLKDIVGEEQWPLKTLEENIFSGGYFIYGSETSLSSLNILGNRKDMLFLKGYNVRKKLNNLIKFGLTLFNPDEIYLNFSRKPYKNIKNKLNKLKFSRNGSILYNPINVTISEGNPTEIMANLRDNRSKFSGVNQKITISGESLFEYTGIVENYAKISAYVMENGQDVENVYPNKIQLPLGGNNLNSISVPDNLKNNMLYLEVSTVFPAENVRAKINLIDGSFSEIPALISVSSQRFIINIDQSLFNYKNIEILFDPKSGSGLDILGILSNNNDVGGISLENEVITKTGYKAVSYNKNEDFYSLNGFEVLKFTNKNNSYDNMLSFKNTNNNFKNNALVHTNFANFWTASFGTYGSLIPSTTESSLFLPPYKIQETLDNSAPHISENNWIKSGTKDIINYINFNKNSTPYNINHKYYEKYHFSKTSNYFYSKILYFNRGLEINNLVMIYKIDLHFLLDFLPDFLILPKEDFTTSQRAIYNENFRKYVSNNFFFLTPDGKEIGIASQDILNYAKTSASGETLTKTQDIIYPINYNPPITNSLPIGDITKGLKDLDLGIDIKVANNSFNESYKGIGVNFILKRANGVGGIQGTIYYDGDNFATNSFDDFKVNSDQMMHPFLGHSACGDSIYYGVGVKRLPINYGLGFGIILKYVDSF